MVTMYRRKVKRRIWDQTSGSERSFRKVHFTDCSLPASPSLQPRPTLDHFPSSLVQSPQLNFYTRYPIESSRSFDLLLAIFAISFASTTRFSQFPSPLILRTFPHPPRSTVPLRLHLLPPIQILVYTAPSSLPIPPRLPPLPLVLRPRKPRTWVQTIT